MAASPVQALLGEVRRALWRAQFAAAVRLALWGSAGLMLLAVAVHLAAVAASPGALVWGLAVLWASTMVRTACRRPTDAACALWADRHLGGASAFTTWLEVGQGPPGVASPAAVQRLEQWIAARVPQGLRRLDEQPPSARPAHVLLSLLICAALAALLMLLPDLAPPSPSPAAAAAAFDGADRPMPNADAPEATQLVSEIASALRSGQSKEASEKGQAGRAPGAGSAAADERNGPAAASTSVAASGARAAAGGSPGGAHADARAAAGTPSSTSPGSGREAGVGRDQRADAGTSKASRGTLTVQRSAAGARYPSPQRQADPDRLGSYDEDLGQGAAASHTAAAPPAAAPPTVAETARMSPTESSYVQAWLQSMPRNR